jgi:hypothetical protein
MVDEAKTFMVEDARIIFRNFSGEPSQYNREGDRNFVVLLDRDIAKEMADDGWNIKTLPAREEGDEDQPMITVAVGYKNRPPIVTMIGSLSGIRTRMTEETVGVLDWADFESVDLIARGYDWEVNDKKGTKAYLQTMFVTIREDALQQKYAIPEGDNV